MPEGNQLQPITTTVTEQESASFSQALSLAGTLFLGFLIVTTILVLLGKSLKHSASNRRQTADETRTDQ